jgi:hypothetical protein
MRRLPVLLALFSVAVAGFIRTPEATATSVLTLPIVGFSPGSFVDHTSPSGFGLTDNSPTTMTRYDGGTGHSYNGHAGIDYPTGGMQGYNVIAAVDGVVTSAGVQDDSEYTRG